MEASMIGIDSNHCQIVGKSLSGERAVDEQTFVSMAVLSERLEQVKKLGKGLSGVAFSAEAQKLASRKTAVAVC
jgi:hypothetical protein